MTFLWQGLHAHISRKQPLPFWSPWRAPAESQPVLSSSYCWKCGWCHCGPPPLPEQTHKHIHRHTLPPAEPLSANPGYGTWLDLQLEEAPQMRCQLLLNSLYSSKPHRDVTVFVLWRTVQHLVWKGKLKVDLSLSTCAALMLLFSSTRRSLLTAWNCCVSVSGVILGLLQARGSVLMQQMLLVWLVMTPARHAKCPRRF